MLSKLMWVRDRALGLGRVDRLTDRQAEISGRIDDQNSELREMIARLTARLDEVLPATKYESFDVARLAELNAGLESAKFFSEHLYDKKVFHDDLDLLGYGAGFVEPGDLVLEFGTWSGRTISHLATILTEHALYGFDSFEGLPETWRSDFTAGAFKRADLPAVPDNVELVVGWFDATLPDFLKAHPEPIGFLHVDCDLYSSTQYVLEQVAGQLRDGAVLVFDEFFNYPGWQQHEAKAYEEFLSAHGFVGEYIGCNVRHQQVAVRVHRA